MLTMTSVDLEICKRGKIYVGDERSLLTLESAENSTKCLVGESWQLSS